MTTRNFTIHHDGVAIPVSRAGRGRPLVLCPGLNSTQAGLHELTGLLRRDHHVVTVDLRGHGRASAAGGYSFAAFLRDLAAVTAAVEHLGPPVLAGYSLGADLAVHYAAGHPGAVAGLVLIDGANPVPEPFITEADLPVFRALWESERGAPLTGRQMLELNVEIDGVRARILDRYRRIDLPVRMIMSSSMAGDGAWAARLNRNWRAGVERLVRELPRVRAHWLEADHRLVFTHAPEVARIIGRMVPC
ncbi:alpha/beta fold hydrolase [Nonomuraea typhae]|uniref:alpha/beta fold hydrolase n=1 Tax=Nonomuraea typhae TaxID=2603600 RepID=UPI0012F8223D|nr:alpha/beta fold hydrolase [Nonomuraea typhae]